MNQRQQLTVLSYFICMGGGEVSRFQDVCVCEPAFGNEDQGTKRSGVHSRSFKSGTRYLLLIACALKICYKPVMLVKTRQR